MSRTFLEPGRVDQAGSSIVPDYQQYQIHYSEQMKTWLVTLDDAQWFMDKLDPGHFVTPAGTKAVATSMLFRPEGDVLVPVNSNYPEAGAALTELDNVVIMLAGKRYLYRSAKGLIRLGYNTSEPLSYPFGILVALEPADSFINKIDSAAMACYELWEYQNIKLEQRPLFDLTPYIREP
jgi:hypothetical protein